MGYIACFPRRDEGINASLCGLRTTVGSHMRHFGVGGLEGLEVRLRGWLIRGCRVRREAPGSSSTLVILTLGTMEAGNPPTSTVYDVTSEAPSHLSLRCLCMSCYPGLTIYSPATTPLPPVPNLAPASRAVPILPRLRRPATPRHVHLRGELGASGCDTNHA